MSNITRKSLKLNVLQHVYLGLGTILFQQVLPNWNSRCATSQPETYKVALFLHCIGPQALKIFNGMSFDNTQGKEKLENIVKKFDQFTIGETNKTYERYMFNSRNQSPNETFDAYVAALRTLSQTCNFCERIHESLIRDRIVLGIQNPQTRKRLL